MRTVFERSFTRVVPEVLRMVQIDIAGPTQGSHSQADPRDHQSSVAQRARFHLMALLFFEASGNGNRRKTEGNKEVFEQKETKGDGIGFVKFVVPTGTRA